MKNILATTAIVALTVMPAFAQTTTPAADAPEAVVTDMLATNAAADNLINADVYASNTDTAPVPADSMAAPDENWDNVGTINDLIQNAEGDIVAVVLDIGGFIGVGARQISIPLDDITLVDVTDEADAFFVVYNGPSATLEDAAELDRTAVNADGNSFYTAGNPAVGSDEGRTEELVTTPPPTPQADAITATDTADSTDADEPVLLEEERSVLTAADLQGVTVHDRSGEHVGNISDIVLSDDGQVADVIVDVGGFLGIGARSVAVAFDDIELIREEGAMSSTLRATTMITADQFGTMAPWEG